MYTTNDDTDKIFWQFMNNMNNREQYEYMEEKKVHIVFRQIELNELCRVDIAQSEDGGGWALVFSYLNRYNIINILLLLLLHLFFFYFICEIS